jgi:hypothetical protein
MIICQILENSKKGVEFRRLFVKWAAFYKIIIYGRSNLLPRKKFGRAQTGFK